MALPRARTTSSAPSYLSDDLSLRFKRALHDPVKLDAFWTDTLAEAERAASSIETELMELRTLLQQVDPFRALGALHLFDAFRRGSVPGPANFGSDAMLELLATAICSEEETALLERIERQFQPQILWTIEQVMNRIANYMAVVETGRVFADRQRGESSPLLSLLRLENAFDRMSGFDPHVRRVVTTVFSRVDDRARQKLGFALSDSLDFASLYSRVRLVHADRAALTMENFKPPKTFANEDEKVRWGAVHMTYFALNSAPPLEGGELDEWLAEQLKLDDKQFAALVEAMSTKVGSVDPEKILSDTSVRTRPLLRLSSTEWMWARPIDFLHGAMEWALEVCKTDQQLLQSFDAARQSVAEELTADLLEEVFGSDGVFKNVTYPDTESDAENDTIVSLPGVALLVEAKGGRFSAPGRRAAPLRVEKHAKELVVAAARQNHRTAKAIADNKTLNDKDRRIVPTAANDDFVPIVVTLDRVDPFSTFLGQPSGSGAGQRNWVLNLADLVMIADILPTPEEFVAYARQRLRMVRDDTRVFVEADCLGHWCEDRTARVESISDSSGKTLRMVSQTAAVMNDYFTQPIIDEMDVDERHQWPGVTKPSTGIPGPVLASLQAKRSRGSEEWLALVDEVANVAPKSWRPVERLLRALDRTSSRPPGRELTKRIRKAQGGLTIGGGVVVTLVSTESAELEVGLVPGAIASETRT